MSKSATAVVEVRGEKNSHGILTNALSSLVAYGLYLPVALFSSRVIVHGVGVEKFGIWATLTTIVGAGSLLDFGIFVPLVKYTAEYAATGRTREISVLLSSATALYAAVAAAFATVMVAASGWVLPHFFHGTAQDTTTSWLYFLTVAGFSLTVAFSGIRCVIVGVHRADLYARLGLACNVCGAIGGIVAVEAGLGLTGLMASWLFFVGLTVGGNWLVARRLVPSLTLSPRLVRWETVRTIFVYGRKVQISTALETLNEHVDRLLLAYALGTTLVGPYALAAQAARAVRGVTFALLNGLLPAAADLSILGDRRKLQALYLEATRYVAFAVFALCGIGAALAAPLVSVWLGPGYQRVAQTLSIILLGFSCWLGAQSTVDTLNAAGKATIVLRGDAIFLCCHIPASAVLLWKFGYFGTVVGTAVALACTRIYIVCRGARALGVPVLTLFRRGFLHPMVAAVVAGIAGIALQAVAWPSALVALVVESTACVLMYCAYIVVAALDNRDRTHLLAVLSTLNRSFRPKVGFLSRRALGVGRRHA